MTVHPKIGNEYNQGQHEQNACNYQYANAEFCGTGHFLFSSFSLFFLLFHSCHLPFQAYSVTSTACTR